MKAPFVELRQLLANVPASGEVINLAVGEPQHAPPAFVGEYIASGIQDGELGRYPTIRGSDALRQAIAAWLKRRFGVEMDAAQHILPVCGTREALFLMGICARQYIGKRDSVIFVPDPSYQCYQAAALGAGCEVVLLSATQANHFLPDLDDLEEKLNKHYGDRVVAFYLCSPANPQGAVADKNYLAKCIELAQLYDFIMITDECYAELYDRTPPPSLLEQAQAYDFKRAMVFHSLSKRSNLPGLRSGFCAGDAELMDRFRIMRELGAVAMPLPTQKASAAVWAEDSHVEHNRFLYRQKFDLAEEMLGKAEGFYRPLAGFFLWLDIRATGLSDEEMTQKLFREAGVSVLPGS